MDPQLLINIAQGLLAFILVMVMANLYLVLRLKEIDPFAKWNPNLINPALFVVFCVVGLIAAFASAGAWSDTFMLVDKEMAASEHGVEIDRMFWNTMWVSVIVVVVTNVLLFFYSWMYRAKPGRKAHFYPHNDRLELIWTIVPAIVLTLLVFDGVKTWNSIMRDAPEESMEVELNAKQFDWTFRYPGSDLEFGAASVQYIDEASSNQLGFNFEDRRGHDDLVTTELHFPVGVPINLIIKSRDVLHSATLPHFRVKMDAVPGMPTSFWFTPTKTTQEMRTQTGNPEFNYELSCQQICGSGHWNMRRVIVVESMEEYKKWLAAQKPFYATWKELNGGASVATTETAPANSVAVNP